MHQLLDAEISQKISHISFLKQKSISKIFKNEKKILD
jgi:hypothetical protein